MADGPSYRHSIVAFIDILGFTSLVLTGRAELAFKVLAEVHERQQHMRRAEQNHGASISMFSDSILISAPVEKPLRWQAVVVVSYFQHLYLSLLAKGICCRGAIVAGDLHHDDPVAFGPAVIAAYQMEQSAIYPRILVADEVAAMRIAAEQASLGKGPPENAIFKKDKDGRRFIRMFTPGAPIPQNLIRRNWTERNGILRKAIRRQLNAEIPPSVQQKLVWLLADIDEDILFFKAAAKQNHGSGRIL